MGIALTAIVAVIYFAYVFYVKRKTIPLPEGAVLHPVHKTIFHKYYVDEFYAALITRPLNKISDLFYRTVELKFIDGIVNSFGRMTEWSAGKLRYAQTGSVGFYIFTVVISMILILFLMQV